MRWTHEYLSVYRAACGALIFWDNLFFAQPFFSIPSKSTPERPKGKDPQQPPLKMPETLENHRNKTRKCQETHEYPNQKPLSFRQKKTKKQRL